MIGYSDVVIADTMEDLEARGFCFDPLSGDPCVGLGEQRPRAFARPDWLHRSGVFTRSGVQ
jgi:hypothetical protein